MPGAKLRACRKAEACVARDDTALHKQKIPSVTTPRRDRTKKSEAEPLDAKRRSIGSGRPPSNGAPQGKQGRQGQSPECGTARRKRQLPSSRRHRRPGPLSARTRLVPGTNKKKVRALKYSPRRRTTPTDELSHPLDRHPGASGGCTTPTDHVKGEKLPKYPFVESHDSIKASGANVGTTIRDTLIGALRSP